MPPPNLLLAERLAVGALVHSRVGFVGTDHDPVQGAVILGVAVISALLDGAFNALVGMAVHRISSFVLGSPVVLPEFQDICVAFFAEI